MKISNGNENGQEVLRAVLGPDPRNYGEALRSAQKGKWSQATHEELQAMVCEVVLPPKRSHVLHNKWVFKTKTEANVSIERFNATLVACDNEQIVGADYTLTLQLWWTRHSQGYTGTIARMEFDRETRRRTKRVRQSLPRRQPRHFYVVSKRHDCP